MLDVRYSTKFKKDFKTCVKRGYKMSLLQQAIDTLRIPAPLPAKNRDHNLSGNLLSCCARNIKYLCLFYRWES